jgi:hypothetical protein
MAYDIHTPLPPIIPIIISGVIAIIGCVRESLPSLLLSASSSSFIVIIQLVVMFAGAVISSIVVVTITAIASGVPIIVAITSGTASLSMAIAHPLLLYHPRCHH